MTLIRFFFALMQQQQQHGLKRKSCATLARSFSSLCLLYSSLFKSRRSRGCFCTNTLRIKAEKKNPPLERVTQEKHNKKRMKKIINEQS